MAKSDFYDDIEDILNQKKTYSLNDAIVEPIKGTDGFRIGNYIQDIVIIIDKNGYVNMTKIFKDMNMCYGEWKQTDEYKNAINEVLEQKIVSSNIPIEIKHNEDIKELNGTYIYHEFVFNILIKIDAILHTVNNIISNINYYRLQNTKKNIQDQIDKKQKKEIRSLTNKLNMLKNKTMFE